MPNNHLLLAEPKAKPKLGSLSTSFAHPQRVGRKFVRAMNSTVAVLRSRRRTATVEFIARTNFLPTR